MSIQDVAQHAEDRHVNTLAAMFVNPSWGGRRLNSRRHRDIMRWLGRSRNPFQFSSLRVLLQLDVPGAATASSPT